MLKAINATSVSLRRIGLVVGALLLAILGVVASVVIWRVDIDNQSGKPIHSITVAVADKRVFRGSLAVGEVAHRWFFVPKETTYTVQVKFADASTLTAEVGYLDPFGGFHDRLVISSDAIKLEPPAHAGAS